MKYKTTSRDEMYGNKAVIKVGYCQLDTLLTYECPDSYTSGMYGWNADIYHFNGVAICTGHRPFGDVVPDYETVQRFEMQAQEVAYGSAPWESKKEVLKSLIDAFIAEVTNGIQLQKRNV